MRLSRSATLIGWLLLVVVAIGAVRYYTDSRHRYSGEAFLAFYCGGSAMNARADPYAVEPLRSCEHRNDPSFALPREYVEPAPLPGYALFPFSILARLPYHDAERIWYTLLFLSLYAAAVACARMAAIPVSIALVGLSVIGGLANVFYGENVPVVLAALSFAGLFLQRRRPIPAAICAGVTLFEPHIGVAVCIALFLWAPATRWTLAGCAALLSGLNLLTAGPAVSLEYFTKTLPLHARAEIGALDQYSATWVLHATGVHDSTSLLIGSLSYLFMLWAGITVAMRLAKRWNAPEFLAYTPAAFVLIGGSFVHDVQMVLAVPLGYALTRNSAYPRVAWICVMLLCIPSAIWWGNLRTPGLTTLVVFTVACYAFSRANLPAKQVLFAAVAAAFLTAGYMGVGRLLPSQYTAAHVVQSDIAGAANQSASGNWARFIHSSSPASGVPARYLAGKAQTWLALLAMVWVSLASLKPNRIRAQNTSRPSEPRAASSGAAVVRMTWLDAMKGLALVWIILNHIVERIFGGEYVGNPSRNWPPLSDRIAQLLPIQGHGAVIDALITIVRDAGWLGDTGVGVFLVLSGFGLTYGLRASGHMPRLPEFYKRRLARIYPTWWGAHILFVALALVLGTGLDPFNARTALSFLGVRFLPQTFYYFAPAWWYVGLLLQLYLVFPLLYSFAVRRGPLALVLAACGIGFAARALGLYTFGSYVDEWQRGAFFVTRLPEFAFGVSLAWWWTQDCAIVDRFFRSSLTVLASALLFIIGTGLSLTLAGMIIGPFILTAASFGLAYAALRYSAEHAPRLEEHLGIAGRHSYAVYLVHQPLVSPMFPSGSFAMSTLASGIIGFCAAVTILTAALERGVAAVERWWQHAVTRRGLAGACALAACILLSVYASLIAADAAVTRYSPEEIDGWGERPALAASGVFGWTLKPRSVTRLRWETYDYVVTANALGFPGPDFPTRKAPGTIRILTVGDAFTSAEGVDTNQAWPRLAQSMLAARVHRRVEVMNTAITGYGPNQYDAVVRALAPRYRADVVVVGMFVNDYGDVLTPNAAFIHAIGLDRRPIGAIKAHLRLLQLKRFVRLAISQKVADAFGKTNPEGYALGNFAFFERRPSAPYWTRGAHLVSQRLADIAAVARRNHASLAVVLFPASVQICDRNQLNYYPRSLDINDAGRFDTGLPQRVTAKIARSVGASYLDLRDALGAGSRCMYQPGNMHLTSAGQRAAAGIIASWLRVP